MRQLSKATMLATMTKEHDRLLQTLAALSDTDWLRVGVIGLPEPGQSCKDILAHLTAWEQRMLHMISNIRQRLPQSTYPATGVFNAHIFYANQARALADVQADFARSYAETYAIVERLSEAELGQDGVWQLVGYNTYSHYKWARTVIRRWQKGQSQDKG